MESFCVMAHVSPEFLVFLPRNPAVKDAIGMSCLEPPSDARKSLNADSVLCDKCATLERFPEVLVRFWASLCVRNVTCRAAAPIHRRPAKICGSDMAAGLSPVKRLGFHASRCD